MTLSDNRSDSVFTQTVLGGTIDFRRDTVLFSIVVTRDSILISCPEITTKYQRLPRYCLSSSDTLRFVLPETVPNSSSAMYHDSIGLLNHSRRSGGINSSSASINLLDCIPGLPTDAVKTVISPPKRFFLEQNFPNPFNPSTTFNFHIPSRSYVSLKVFDVLGKEAATIISEELFAGDYSRCWNTANMASGIYFYRLQARQTSGGQAGSFTETKKLILLK